MSEEAEPSTLFFLNIIFLLSLTKKATNLQKIFTKINHATNNYNTNNNTNKKRLIKTTFI